MGEREGTVGRTTIEIGDEVWWAAKVGVWHKDCAEPRNLKHYLREAEGA